MVGNTCVVSTGFDLNLMFVFKVAVHLTLEVSVKLDLGDYRSYEILRVSLPKRRNSLFPKRLKIVHGDSMQ